MRADQHAASLETPTDEPPRPGLRERDAGVTSLSDRCSSVTFDSTPAPTPPNAKKPPLESGGFSVVLT
jgi:hypothetical protein